MQACGSHLDIRQSGGGDGGRGGGNRSRIEDVKYSFASGLLCTVSNLVSKRFFTIEIHSPKSVFQLSQKSNVFKSVFSYHLIPLAGA